MGILQGGRIGKDRWRVFTFYSTEDGQPNTRTVRAYTGYVSTEWDGRMYHTITAPSGRRAKQLATRDRIEHELLRRMAAEKEQG